MCLYLLCQICCFSFNTVYNIFCYRESTNFYIIKYVYLFNVWFSNPSWEEFPISTFTCILIVFKELNYFYFVYLSILHSRKYLHMWYKGPILYTVFISSVGKLFEFKLIQVSLMNHIWNKVKNANVYYVHIHQSYKWLINSLLQTYCLNVKIWLNQASIFSWTTSHKAQARSILWKQ